jgi:hypothetical protein
MRAWNMLRLEYLHSKYTHSKSGVYLSEKCIERAQNVLLVCILSEKLLEQVYIKGQN